MGEKTHPSGIPIAEQLERFVEADPSVPCLPEVAIKLCSLTRNDNAHVQELCEIIALDPGLAAACLRIASSVTRTGRQIDHLDHAVFLLGVSEIRNMALNIVLLGAFAPMQSRLHGDEFWVHNVCVAKLTHLLAGCTTAEHGHAYLAGLLHDVGKLVIERHFPEEYSAVLAAALENHCSQFQMERRLLGIDHARIGELICRRLGVHDQVTGAISCHHDVRFSRSGEANVPEPAQELAICIAAADYLVHQASSVGHGEICLAEHLSSFPQWQRLNERGAFDELRLDVTAEMDRARREFAAVAKGFSNGNDQLPDASRE